MAFEVRNYTTTCPAELIDAINNGSPNIGPTLFQIIQGLTPGEVFEITGETGGGSPSASVFEFTSALSAGEESIFDNTLATFVCPVDDTNLVDEQDFSDDHGPDENVIWSSEKITNDFVNVPGDTMTGTLTLSSGNINVNTGGLRVGHTFTSGYTLSVQSNTASTHIEILNNAGTNKGAFFGVENYLTPNDFALYNWQGGPITFYTDTTASSENRRMVIQPNGDVEIKNLTAGFVKSAADGTLSSGVISESDISDLGNYAVIGGAHHDTFSDFVANEHINHTNVTLTAGAGLSGGGNITANRSFSVNVQNSIEIDTDTLQLVNDAASPGNNKVYGTNGSGVKGWKDDPAGVGALGDLSDVDLTGSPSPTAGDYLAYNGSSWVNVTGEPAAASKQMNSWTLLSGSLYYNDFAHNLDTTEISVYLYDTISKQEVRPEYTEIIDSNTIRVVVDGNAEDLTCNVLTGAFGPPGPQGPAGGGMSNVVEDTTPQLGGNLDLNGNSIIAAGPVTITTTEMSYIDGVTSNIQSQINGKTTATGHTHVFRLPHTWAISGEVKVPAGDTDYIIPFFVSLASGQTAKLVKARHRINSGTSVTCKLQKNAVDITGFTSITVNTTASDTDPADVTLAGNDMIALVVTGVSGTPKNMTFTLFIEYTQ